MCVNRRCNLGYDGQPILKLNRGKYVELLSVQFGVEVGLATSGGLSSMFQSHRAGFEGHREPVNYNAG